MPFRKELLNRLSSPTLHSNIQWRYLGRYPKATRSATTPQTGYHVTPAAALPVSEIRRDLSAAFRACYRGGKWIEATAGRPLNRPDQGRLCAIRRCRRQELRL